MKGIIVVLLASVVLVSGAEHGTVGLGVILGEPTGLSAKVWLPDPTALDFALGWSLTADWFYLHTTYLYHFYNVIPEPHLSLYLGLGGRLKFLGRPPHDTDKSRLRLGPRLSGGMEFIYRPIGIFFELGPVIDLLPETNIDMTGGFGIRLFFPLR